MADDILNFVRESNEIENIKREPTQQEIEELQRFSALPLISINEIIKFVQVYEPAAKLRDSYDCHNVRIGKYIPPFSGPEIRDKLEELLLLEKDPYDFHIKYEKLHPFTDCNGRSGRAIWLWFTKNIEEGFLKPFYLETVKRLSI